MAERTQEMAKMYQVIADGIPWVDADGKDEWEWDEAVMLAAMLEGVDYAVAIPGTEEK
jgi:hypothetical protein